MRYSVSRNSHSRAEPGRDPVQAGPGVAHEAVGEAALVVAHVGVIEAGVAFQDGLAAHVSLPGQRHRQQCVPDRRPLAQRATAAARALEIAAGQARAERDRAVHLVLGEAQHLRGGDRGTEDAEHRTGVKPARHHRRDEVRGQPFHDLVAGDQAGDEIPAGGPGRFRRDERARNDAGARVREHPERVPLAAGEGHLRPGERGAAPGHAGAVHHDGGAVAHAGLVLDHELHGLPTFGGP